ncbi:unnamed protein product [Staurois parvus]|uniref:Olfactory receptor n=1 Tax=Staurois parvus TaxID=386267 RepID=A0ABN9F8R9_9NEOB|nr:unnamed protein product [Staurois parvus]
MYFFLSQLSLSDLIMANSVGPILLHVLVDQQTTITFAGCLAQFYFFSASLALETLLLTVMMECFLLTIMSYDRYLAICCPLHYNTIMSFLFCIKAIITSWSLSALLTILQAYQVSQLQFCGPNTMDHFFCDFEPLLRLSCSNVFTVRLTASILGIPLLFCSFIVVVLSYTYIIFTVVKMKSISGRKKAFSTCSSHLFVVSLYYGTLNAKYLVPTKEKSSTMGKALSVLYTVITPLFNPIIYSVRNKDFTKAYSKLMAEICS